jgi:hypothetical protein
MCSASWSLSSSDIAIAGNRRTFGSPDALPITPGLASDRYLKPIAIDGDVKPDESRGRLHHASVSLIAVSLIVIARRSIVLGLGSTTTSAATSRSRS